MSEGIDHDLACKCRDLLPGGYFGNSHTYGELRGYHVGDIGMICVYVSARHVPEWKELHTPELVQLLTQKVKEAALPVKISPEPEFVSGDYQVYFTIED